MAASLLLGIIATAFAVTESTQPEPTMIAQDANQCAERTSVFVRENKLDETLLDTAEIPDEFTSIMTSGPGYVAVTIGPKSVTCVRFAEFDDVTRIEWVEHGRLLGISWYGYEIFGYKLIDVSSPGEMIEIGASPLVTDKKTKLAALQVSDSGWGDFEGFAVWAVEADHLKPLSYQASLHNDPPPEPFQSYYADWQLVGWQGDACINLIATPYDIHPENPMDKEPLSFYSSEAENWKVKQGTCAGGDAS